MLKKNESAYSASTYSKLLSSGLNSSLGASLASVGGMPGPGQPYRWALPDDPTGFNGVANMYTTMDMMSNVYTGYTIMQAAVLLMLMIRLIHYVSFQPRLAIVSGTLARMIPDLCHYTIVFVTMACMLAMVLTTVFGYRVKSVSSFTEALTLLVEYVIVKKGKANVKAIGIAVSVPFCLIAMVVINEPTALVGNASYLTFPPLIRLPHSRYSPRATWWPLLRKSWPTSHSPSFRSLLRSSCSTSLWPR